MPPPLPMPLPPHLPLCLPRLCCCPLLGHKPAQLLDGGMEGMELAWGRGGREGAWKAWS